MTAEDIDAIVRDELRTTERSVADLDSICDTTLVGITFLLAGVATWGGFGFGRLADGAITPVLAWPFYALVVLSASTTTVAVGYIVRGLFPRQFYTDQVGETLLESTWLPTSRGETSQAALLERARSTSADAYVDEFLEGYDHRGEVDDHASFSKVRLRNLKLVAGVKARATAKGLAWFRLGVAFFLGSLVYGAALVLLLG